MTTWAPIATAPGIPPPKARFPAFRKTSRSGGFCELSSDDMMGVMGFEGLGGGFDRDEDWKVMVPGEK